MESGMKQPEVCENCPKNIKPGEVFVGGDGKAYCCQHCETRGKTDNTCEFC